MVGLVPDGDLLRPGRGWVRDFCEALRPHAIASGDGYINGTAGLEADRVREGYGAVKYERLAKIKAEYGPDTIIHSDDNFAPARSPSAAAHGSVASRSMRTVSGLVSIALEAHTQSRRARFVRPRIRCRSPGSSPSRMCAVPARQRVRGQLATLTRTCGLASILRTQSARCPA
jgi:hypothetical protein